MILQKKFMIDLEMILLIILLINYFFVWSGGIS